MLQIKVGGVRMKDFKDFLIRKYSLKESSAEDYVWRFNGIVNKGIYKEESEITPSMRAAIENEFPNSKNHYHLALERYILFRKSKL